MTPDAAARWRRTGGAAFAAALTLLPLAALYQRNAPRPPALPQELVAYLSPWRPAPVAEVTPPPVSATVAPQASRKAASAGPLPRERRAAAVAPATALNSATPPDAQPPPSAQPATVAAEPAQSPASTALKLDAAVMRAAATASKSDARHLAEASRAYFGSDPMAQTERLGRAVAETAKPDCIGPGGSLLSVFFIAYQVARDKCK